MDFSSIPAKPEQPAAAVESDQQAAHRIREEFRTVREALERDGSESVADPLGTGQTLRVQLRSFKANGGGELVLLKEGEKGEKRWTRYRAWGPRGTDYVEKTSYLVKPGGHTDFHKRTVDPSQGVAYVQRPEEIDQGWIQGLA